MARSGNTEQAVGFILQIEAEALIKDLRKAEDQYAKFDRTLTGVAKSMKSNAVTIDEAMDKIADAFGRPAVRSNASASETATTSAGRASTSDKTKAQKSQFDSNKRWNQILNLVEKMEVNTRRTTPTGQPVEQELTEVTVKEMKPARAAQSAVPVAGATPQASVSKDLASTFVDQIDKVVAKYPAGMMEGTSLEQGDGAIGQVVSEVMKAISSRSVSLDDKRDMLEGVQGALRERYSKTGGVNLSSDPAQKEIAQDISGAMNNLSSLIDKIKDEVGSLGRGTPISKDGFNADTGDREPGALDDMFSEDMSRSVKNTVDLVRLSMGKMDRQAQGFIGRMIGKGGASAAVMGYVGALGHAVEAASDYQDVMNRVMRVSAATSEQMARISDATQSVSIGTGKSLEDVAKVSATLRGKAGFAEATGEFEEFVGVAMQIGEVVDVNANEMVEFLAETSVAMNMGKKSAKEFGATLVAIAKKGSVSFDELQDSVLATKDIIRNWGMDEAQAKQFAGAAASMTQAFKSVGGEASDAQQLIATAMDRTNENYGRLQRVFTAGGGKGLLSDMMAKDQKQALAVTAKGMDALEEQWKNYNPAMKANLRRQAIGSDTMANALAKMDPGTVDTAFAPLTSNEKNEQELEESFARIMGSLTKTKERLINTFKMFFMSVGTPPLKAIAFVLDKIADLLGAIPAPMYKFAGYALGALISVRAIGVAMKAISKMKMADGLGKLLGGIAGANTPHPAARAKIGKTIAEAVAHSTILTKALDVVKTKLGGATAAAKGLATNMTSSGAGAKGLSTYVKSAGSALKQFFTTFNGAGGSGVKKFFSTTGRGIKNLGRGTGSVGRHLVGWLKHLPKIASWVTKIASGLGSAAATVVTIPLAFAALGAWVTSKAKWAQGPQVLADGLAKVKGSFGSLKDTFSKMFSGDIEGAAYAAESFADQFVTALEALPQKIDAFFADMPRAIDEWADALPAKVETFVSNLSDKVVTFFQNLPAKIEEFFSTLPARMKKWLDEGILAWSTGDNAGAFMRIAVALGKAVLAVFKVLPVVLGKLMVFGALAFVQVIGKAIGGLLKMLINSVMEHPAIKFILDIVKKYEKAKKAAEAAEAAIEAARKKANDGVDSVASFGKGLSMTHVPTVNEQLNGKDGLTDYTKSLLAGGKGKAGVGMRNIDAEFRSALTPIGPIDVSKQVVPTASGPVTADGKRIAIQGKGQGSTIDVSGVEDATSTTAALTAELCATNRQILAALLNGNNKVPSAPPNSTPNRAQRQAQNG